MRGQISELLRLMFFRNGRRFRASLLSIAWLLAPIAGRAAPTDSTSNPPPAPVPRRNPLEPSPMALPAKHQATLLGGTLRACDGRDAPQEPVSREMSRVMSLGEMRDSDCELRLPAGGMFDFGVGNLVELRQDASAFHLVAGNPVPDHMWVPGLFISHRSTPLALGIGTAGSAQMIGVLALKLSF
jgi:hypothetical protein